MSRDASSWFRNVLNYGGQIIELNNFVIENPFKIKTINYERIWVFSWSCWETLSK